MFKNSVRRHAKLSAILLIAIMALMGQSLVAAQKPTKEVEIVGTVSTLTAQTLTLGNQTFDITHAEIKAGVVAGALVKIHATPSTTGIWVAREVELARVSVTQTPSPATTPQPTPLDEFEITGQITALTTTTIVIVGQTIDISNAEIKNALALNELVKIHVSIVNGVWVAREVEAASIPVTGTITPTFDRRGHGNDDDDHDVNDDHGDHNGNDDDDHHGGSDDNQGNNDNNGGGDNSNSGSGHDGGNGSGGHGHG